MAPHLFDLRKDKAGQTSSASMSSSHESVSVNATDGQPSKYEARQGKTERECMEQGLPYLPYGDQVMTDARTAVKSLVKAYNDYPWPQPPAEYFGPDERRELLAKIFGLSLDEIKSRPIEIEPPLWVDYGSQIDFTGSFYANTGLVILDAAKVKIGTRVLCGPRVGIYSATHSTDIAERTAGYERAYPIDIGDDCWIGAGVIINSPTKLGKGCTVASGAVLRGVYPDHCVIGGVPARVLKQLTPGDASL